MPHSIGLSDVRVKVMNLSPIIASWNFHLFTQAFCSLVTASYIFSSTLSIPNQSRYRRF